MSNRHWWSVAVAAATAALSVVAPSARAQGLPDHVPGRLLVQFQHGTSKSVADGIVAQQHAKIVGEIAHTDYKVVQLPARASEVAMARAFGQRREVVQSQLDLRKQPDNTPNDPQYGAEWHLVKIGGPNAWNTTVGSASVIVAILDTGVDGTHPDLSAKLVPGWNTWDNNSNTADVYGHGTAVAGTAAASGNNGIGVASVAWNASIMPVRISDANGYGYSSTVASGLTWAADHGAKVANISYEFNNDMIVQNAAQYFMGKGGVVTMSAGNYSTVSTAPDNPYVLTVSASDANDAIASWSNTGSNVDLAAPGVNITTTNRGGGYGGWSGTSFSAPTVAGVAALVYSVKPGLTGAQVQDILKQSADDLGAPGWDPQYGWGRVNAANAVVLAGTYTGDTTPPTVSFSSPADGAVISGTATLYVSAADNVAVDTVAIYKNGVLVTTLLSAPYNYSWNTLNDANGAVAFQAVARDLAGNQATANLSLTVNNVKDTTAPTVAITSPLGGTIGNTVTVYVSATDNVGVTKCALYVDGKLVASSTASPFTMKWNARKVSNGSHTLQVKAYDAAGNVGLSQIVPMTH